MPYAWLTNLILCCSSYFIRKNKWYHKGSRLFSWSLIHGYFIHLKEDNCLRIVGSLHASHSACFVCFQFYLRNVKYRIQLVYGWMEHIFLLPQTFWNKINSFNGVFIEEKLSVWERSSNFRHKATSSRVGINNLDPSGATFIQGSSKKRKLSKTVEGK